MKSNPTLLSLLEAGAIVELPNEVKLTGLPDSRYIRISFAGTRQGQWSLDREGLRNAMDDAERIYAEHRGDDFSDITEVSRKRGSGYVGGITIMTREEAVGNIHFENKNDKMFDYNIVNEEWLWLWGCNSRVEIRREWDRRLHDVIEYGHKIAVRYTGDTGGIYNSVDEAEDAISANACGQVGPRGEPAVPLEIHEIRRRGNWSERVHPLYLDVSVSLRARP